MRRFATWLVAGALAAVVTFPAAPAHAERELFFEETAGAFWAVSHVCADGSTVEGTLLVQTTRDFGSPDTEDQDPTARLQFQAVCPGGISFTWGAPTAPATITSEANLKSVTAARSAVARDNLGGTHPVSFDVADWLRTDTHDGQRAGQQAQAASRDCDRADDLRWRRARRRPGQPPNPAGTLHPSRHRAVVRSRRTRTITWFEEGSQPAPSSQVTTSTWRWLGHVAVAWREPRRDQA
jgi:hypothetical protein